MPGMPWIWSEGLYRTEADGTGYVAAAGGWKSTETLRRVYQQPDSRDH